MCDTLNYCRDGKRPWSYLTHLLSGRLRTWRHNKKYKYSPSSTIKRQVSCDGSNSDGSSPSGSSDSTPPLPSSQMKGEYEAELNNMSKDDYNCCMNECKKLMEKKTVKRQDIKMILKKTFGNRRNEIKKMDEEGLPMMSSVIVDWSCFTCGAFVSFNYYKNIYKVQKWDSQSLSVDKGLSKSTLIDGFGKYW